MSNFAWGGGVGGGGGGRGHTCSLSISHYPSEREPYSYPITFALGKHMQEYVNKFKGIPTEIKWFIYSFFMFITVNL